MSATNMLVRRYGKVIACPPLLNQQSGKELLGNKVTALTNNIRVLSAYHGNSYSVSKLLVNRSRALTNNIRGFSVYHGNSYSVSELLVNRSRALTNDIRGFCASTINKRSEKKLFTPGPLSVSRTTKEAMLWDLGSRDFAFQSLVKETRKFLVELAGVSTDKYTCVPLQGSGTYSIEGVLTTSVCPKNGKILLLENGAYGKRMQKICEVLSIPYITKRFPDNQKVDVKAVEQSLREIPDVTNVAVVHCETSSGIINPIQEIGQMISRKSADISYFVDAMSSFGAIELSMQDSSIDFLVSSANKCLEGVPGFSFVICNTEKLLACKGWSRSYSLDLCDQYEYLETTGQFRFTPPTHTMLAFSQALREFKQHGELVGRKKRYLENNEILRTGMAKLGFKEYLKPEDSSYIITTYHFPSHPRFNFQSFYTKLSDRGQVIYPGKVLEADCFRIGNIGHLFPRDMQHLLSCIEDVCLEMGISLPIQI